MQDFRNLNVWQAARRLTRSVYKLTRDFPQSEEFGLKAQMRRASVSICSTIAEGCGRRGDREFRRFLDISMGSCCELECELILSFDLAFIPETAADAAIAALIEIKRMLGGLIQQLRISSKAPKQRSSAGDASRSHRSATAGARSKPTAKADSR